MGVRLNPRQDDRCRSAIQTSQLINRLQKFAFASPDDKTWPKDSMNPDQVRAALGLMRKTLPDLQTTAITGPEGGALVIRWEREKKDGDV